MIKKVLTYDIEIKNCVPDKDEPNDQRWQYCQGWEDKAGMGIAVLAAYKGWNDRIEFFDESNILGFLKLIKEAELVQGFNIHGFDTPVLKATLKSLGHEEETGMRGKCYDIFFDIKKSLNNNFPKGWSLDNVAVSTLGLEKSEDGADAPKFYQSGELARLFNYVSRDVTIEHKLFCYAWEKGIIKNDEAVPYEVELQGIKKWREN